MYGYSPLVRDAEIESALRRSRVDNQISEAYLRRSRIEAEMYADEALRRSRRDAANQLAVEASLKRSRVQAKIAAEREQREAALIKSRFDAEIEEDKFAREEILRRSRRDAENRIDKVGSALAKSRYESSENFQRAHEKRKCLNTTNRRSRVQANVESILRNY